MAVQDPLIEARHLRRCHLDFALAIGASAALGAAVTLQVAALVTGRSLVDAGLTSMLWVLATLVTMAWLVTSSERRLARHLYRIEGSRYRDGYAAGYLDAAARVKNKQHYDRPQLRPVR
jgi:hypothetical protein